MLKQFLVLHTKPITWESSTFLKKFISGPISCLDAFSNSFGEMWLHGDADESTTMTLEISPSRSSRTRVSFLQFFNAYGR